MPPKYVRINVVPPEKELVNEIKQALVQVASPQAKAPPLSARRRHELPEPAAEPLRPPAPLSARRRNPLLEEGRSSRRRQYEEEEEQSAAGSEPGHRIVITLPKEQADAPSKLRRSAPLLENPSAMQKGKGKLRLVEDMIHDKALEKDKKKQRRAEARDKDKRAELRRGNGIQIGLREEPSAAAPVPPPRAKPRPLPKTPPRKAPPVPKRLSIRLPVEEADQPSLLGVRGPETVPSAVVAPISSFSQLLQSAATSPSASPIASSGSTSVPAATSTLISSTSSSMVVKRKAPEEEEAPSQPKRYEKLLSLANEGKFKQMLEETSLLELFIMYPLAFITLPPILYGDGNDYNPINGQIGKESMVLNANVWPQSTALPTYGADSPFQAQAGVSGVVTDPSNSPTTSTGMIFDEVPQQRLQEDKNAQGNLAAYRVYDERGLSDHSFPVNYIPAGGSASSSNISQKWAPNVAVADPSVWTDANTTVTGYSLLTTHMSTTKPTYWQPHGLMLPMGFSAKDSDSYAYNDGAKQSTAVPGVAAGVVATNSLTETVSGTADAPAAQCINTMTSCFVISAGSAVAGVSNFIQGDSVTATMYGYNEGERYQVATSTIEIPAALPSEGTPLFYFPTGLSDYYSFTIGVSSIQSNQAPRSNAGKYGAYQETRNLKFGFFSAAGSFRHLMAPSDINDVNLLGLWSGTRVTSASMYVDNATAFLTLGGKIGWYQPVKTHWQACGIDTGAPYDFIKKHVGEIDFEAKEGGYGYFQPGGKGRMELRNNINANSKLGSTYGSAVSAQSVGTGFLQLTFDLDNRLFAMQVIVCPPGQASANAQFMEKTWVTAWEGRSDKQVLKLMEPNTEPEEWEAATKFTARLRHAYKLPDVEYFASTVDWRKNQRAATMMRTH